MAGNAIARRLLLPLFCAAVNGLGQATNPNPLAPVAHDADDYRQTVRKALVDQGAPGRVEFWMITFPSFQPECALALKSEPIDPKPEKGKSSGQKRRWYLESATATQRIWHYKDFPEDYHGPFELDLRWDVKVDRKKWEIDDSSANALLRAWSTAARMTRPAEKEYQFLDGVTYEFYADEQSGEKWRPQTDLPAALTRLATQLRNVLEGAPADQLANLQVALGKAGQIQREAAEAIASARNDVLTSTERRSWLSVSDFTLDNLPSPNRDRPTVDLSVDKGYSMTGCLLHVKVTSRNLWVLPDLSGGIPIRWIRIKDQNGIDCPYTEYGKKIIGEESDQFAFGSKRIYPRATEEWRLPLERYFKLTPGTWSIEVEVNLTVQESARPDKNFGLGVEDLGHPGKSFACRIRPTQLLVTFLNDPNSVVP